MSSYDDLRILVTKLGDQLVALDPPLVDDSSAKDHLILMGAFTEFLRAQGCVIDKNYLEDVSFRNILHRAQHRLDLWLRKIVGLDHRKALQPNELPPLDVALVLHAYMISPHYFYEDSHSRVPELSALAKFPLHELVNLIDSSQFTYNPSKEQVDHWYERTSVPFDPVNFLKNLPTLHMDCPRCGNTVAVKWNDDGTGFTEVDFAAQCPSCEVVITHSRLRSSALLQALSAVQNDSEARFPGTMLDKDGLITDQSLVMSRERSERILHAIIDVDGNLPSGDSPEVILSTIKDRLDAAGIATERTLYPLMHNTRFSQDLVYFAGELAQFHAAMHDRVKASPISPQELRDGYEEYCRFLAIAAYPELGYACPTERGDLFWHTHQLMGDEYRVATVMYLKRHLNHTKFTAASGTNPKAAPPWSPPASRDFVDIAPESQLALTDLDAAKYPWRVIGHFIDSKGQSFNKLCPAIGTAFSGLEDCGEGEHTPEKPCKPLEDEA
ncbi:hypothetical protein HGRIS_000128 [Hohenbuehelia grisea]|uniref:Uncharacterized protein n=1 Tax=Hohenbuehelia grisea TaxID=104357 RepID=A0ABR3JRG5_9AGAR